MSVVFSIILFLILAMMQDIIFPLHTHVLYSYILYVHTLHTHLLAHL